MMLLLQMWFAWVEDYFMRPDEIGSGSPFTAVQTPYFILYWYYGIGASAGLTEIEFFAYLHLSPLIASMFMEDVFLVVFVWHFHTEHNISDPAL